MPQRGRSFSIIRLNNHETGWGVVDDATGALVHVDGLAIRLSKQRAVEIAQRLNDEAQENGDAVDRSSL